MEPDYRVQMKNGLTAHKFTKGNEARIQAKRGQTASMFTGTAMGPGPSQPKVQTFLEIAGGSAPIPACPGGWPAHTTLEATIGFNLQLVSC
eukprot:1144113-Pelagomonas_calceolata.AAC.7